MRIVLAGASGLIGSALKTTLRGSGHQVDVLVRRVASGSQEFTWDPAHGQLDPAVLVAADAVVCLSGVGVGDHRWSEKFKQRIIDSRVRTVATIAETLAAHGGPKIFLAASAVGYYGDRGDEVLTEGVAPGNGFLADVCTRWEAAAAPAVTAGVRTVNLRTGLVLSSDGGMLGRLRPIVKAGVGGKFGPGTQFMPWISMLDELHAIEFLLTHEVSGPVNLTAPSPARNAEFMKTLGSVLHRPAVLPTPGFALKLALGEFGGEALASQRAVPTALLDAGFEFSHTELEGAMRWALTG